MNRGKFIMFYSGNTDSNRVGIGFLVHKEYKTGDWLSQCMKDYALRMTGKSNNTRIT
jgi:hypothetical protein